MAPRSRGGSPAPGSAWCVWNKGDWVRSDVVPHTDIGWEVARQRAQHPSPNVRGLVQDYPVNEDDTPISLLMYNAVGGSTIHWGAHFPRLHPSDFRMRSLDGVGDDWPLTYDELVAHYDVNDGLTGISGLAGDPANPPRSRRQMPPVPIGRGAHRVAMAFDELGWHWWPVDAAINTTSYDGRGACNNCGPCDLGCPLQARSSTDVTYWPKALRRGVEVRTRSRVRQVTVSPDGRRATGVVYRDVAGSERHQPADVVVLAGNGVGTARLLLLSAGPHHRDGLGNSSGLLGRRLMHHPTGMVTGVFDEPLEGYRGPFAVSIYSQEFYDSDPARGFARGYQMQVIRSDAPLGTALGGYLTPVPWGEGHQEEFLTRFGRTASLTVTAEDLPDEDNRVALDPDLTDTDGIPAPRVSYRVDDNATAMIEHGIARASEVLATAGARRILPQPLVGGAGFHLLGTARMGEDAATSVTDRWGRLHDVENLFVADGSVFVTAGALNPTSTIQALALRTAERIAALGRRGVTAA